MRILATSLELQYGNSLELSEESNKVHIKLITFRESKWIRLEESLGSLAAMLLQKPPRQENLNLV